LEIPIRLVTLENKFNFWYLLVFAIILVYVGFNAYDLFLTDQYPDYPLYVKRLLDNCNYNSIFDLRGAIQWDLVCFSKSLGNEKLLPFIASVCILPLTFLISRRFTGSNILGIVSLLIVFSSGNFYLFDSSSTYPQFWALFFLLSFYLIHNDKFYLFSPFFLILAIFTKPLAFLYLPIILYSINDSNLSNGKKAILYLISIVIIALSIVRLLSVDLGTDFIFNMDNLLHGFVEWFFLLDSSLIVAISIPIVLIQLAKHRLKTGKHYKHKELYTKTIFFGILLMIFMVPLIEGFSDQLNHAYRFVPLIVFVSIGISLVIARSMNFLVNKKFNFISNKDKEK